MGGPKLEWTVPVTGESVADELVVDVDEGEGYVGAIGKECAC